MNHNLGCALLASSTVLFAAGCPIYPSANECYDDWDCPTGYYCNYRNICVRPSSGDGGSGGSAASYYCSRPTDCGSNEVCGTDHACHPGDCSYWGCTEGYACVLDGYRFACLPSSGDAGVSGAAGSAGTAGASGSGGTDAAAPIYCGNPADCTSGQVCAPAGTCVDGTCSESGCIAGYHCSTPDGGAPACVPDNAAACIHNAECDALGASYVCVSGVCTAPENQCSDGTQCLLGPQPQVCVDGQCIGDCSDGEECPTGYDCNSEFGICNRASVACTITNDCASAGLVCVAGACVSRCGAADGGVCPDGFVCVANGCLPDQRPKFDCETEGQVGAPCAEGSICLHHHCYLSCTPGPNACTGNPPELSVCKLVATSTGEYNICGSSTTLGSECGPGTQGECTPGEICIDGYCR